MVEHIWELQNLSERVKRLCATFQDRNTLAIDCQMAIALDKFFLVFWCWSEQGASCEVVVHHQPHYQSGQRNLIDETCTRSNRKAESQWSSTTCQLVPNSSQICGLRFYYRHGYVKFMISLNIFLLKRFMLLFKFTFSIIWINIQRYVCPLLLNFHILLHGCWSINADMYLKCVWLCVLLSGFIEWLK